MVYIVVCVVGTYMSSDSGHSERGQPQHQFLHFSPLRRGQPLSKGQRTLVPSLLAPLYVCVLPTHVHDYVDM